MIFSDFLQIIITARRRAAFPGSTATRLYPTRRPQKARGRRVSTRCARLLPRNIHRGGTEAPISPPRRFSVRTQSATRRVPRRAAAPRSVVPFAAPPVKTGEKRGGGEKNRRRPLIFEKRYAILSLFCAGVLEWQTRWTQNPLLATACGFKSRHRHHIGCPYRT